MNSIIITVGQCSHSTSILAFYLLMIMSHRREEKANKNKNVKTKTKCDSLLIIKKYADNDNGNKSIQKKIMGN